MPTTLGPHTGKDWLATPECESWELIHGTLVRTAETADKSGLAGRIEREIGNYLDARPLGPSNSTLPFPFRGVTDPDGDAVVSDLSCIPRDPMRTWDGEAKRAKGVIPALVVEILSAIHSGHRPEG